MNTFKGTITKFNDIYGFISFENGTAFFHVSVVPPDFLTYIKKGAKATFTAKPSRKKTDGWDVVTFESIDIPKTDLSQKNMVVGQVAWFDSSKGFGFLRNEIDDSFVHASRIKNATALKEGEICIFSMQPSTKKESGYDAHEVYVLTEGVEEIKSLLDTYLQLTVIINSEHKYQQAVSMYNSLSEQDKIDFIHKAYEIADEERKYQFLVNYCVPCNESELDLIKKLFTEKGDDFSFSIIKNLSEENQILVIDLLLEQLPISDSSVKGIYYALSKKNESIFLQKVYEIATEEQKCQLLKTYPIPNPELTLVKKWFTEKGDDFSFSIIKNLSEENQILVIDLLLEQILISDFFVKNIYNIYNTLFERNKITFIQKIYEIANEEQKYQLLENYVVPDPELSLIKRWLLERQQNLSFSIIRNLSPENQTLTTDYFLEQLHFFDDQYEAVKNICYILNQDVKTNFIRKAYEKADEEVKYKFVIHHLIPSTEIDLIKKWFRDRQYASFFELIDNISKENQILFLKYLQTLSNTYTKVKVENIYNRLHSERKAAFLQKIYEMVDKEKGYKLLKGDAVPNLLVLSFENSNPNIFLLSSKKEQWLFASSFLLLKPKKNKYLGIPLIELALKDIFYIKNETAVFDSPLLSSFMELLESITDKNTRKYKEEVIEVYKGLIAFVVRGLKELNFEEIISQNELSELEKIELIRNVGELSELTSDLSFNEIFFKKQARYLIENTENQLDYFIKNEDEMVERLVSINRIDKQATADFLKVHLIYLSTYVKMRLWINGVYEEFDYNNYGFYHFRLNRYEKKIYNQKAKKLMKEEVNKVMTAERIPWSYKNTDEQGVNHYLASWRSIWFLNKKIRICVKEIEGQNIFSEPFPVDFSEEKFNFLFGYLSKKRIDEILITEKDGKIIKVNGLEALEENIYKANIEKQVREQGHNTVLRQEGEMKIPPSFIIKNQCASYLSDKQDTDKKPIRVLEISKNYTNGSIQSDTSLLFTITKDETVFVIWESLEFSKSKATHIFKMSIQEYDIAIKDINQYLETNLKVRSKLNSPAFEDRAKLKYLCRIDHDNFDFTKWENQLITTLEDR